MKKEPLQNMIKDTVFGSENVNVLADNISSWYISGRGGVCTGWADIEQSSLWLTEQRLENQEPPTRKVRI
jgi:hypothetical protein